MLQTSVNYIVYVRYIVLTTTNLQQNGITITDKISQNRYTKS